MNGLKLVITMCQLANANVCQDVISDYEQDVTPQQCIVWAQAQMAKVMDEHPGWRVTRYSCRPANKIERSL